MGVKGVFERRNNNVDVPKLDPITMMSEPGTMENRDGAPRLLAQARRFVNMFCAVLRTTLEIYFAFQIPLSHLSEMAILCFGGCET